MPSTSIAELTATIAGQTVPGRFLDLVRAHPTAPALRSMRPGTPGAWEMWTYAAYADRVSEVAAGLLALGLEPGDRLVLFMRNRPDFHWLDAAAQFLRVTPVSLYTASSAEEVAYVVAHTEARVVVVEDAGLLQRLPLGPERPAALEHVVVLEPPPGGVPDGVLPGDVLYGQGREDLVALADEVDPSDVATLIYTSGTTGPPKGVMLSQSNVVYTVEQLRRSLGLNDLAGRRVISYLPMAHVAERITGHYQPMIHGFDVHCCPDLGQLPAYLREVRPEIFFGVPRIWEKLRGAVYARLTADPERLNRFDQAIADAMAVKEAERAGTVTPNQLALWGQLDSMAFAQVRSQLGLDALVAGITGAAPISRAVLEWFNAIGVPLSEIYGMSESSGPITWSPRRNKPGFVGQAVPGCEVRIAADGEVCCRGGNVFQGYFKQPEATAHTVIDGWLHTGDIGELDHEGYLRIVDRKKELIITAGGKNVSPANLEAALTTLPLIGHACAVGDNRKFITALLALDPDVAEAWAAARGRAGESLASLAAEPELVAEVARGVARANRQFAPAERVKTFTIVGEPWLPGSDVLTPTSKLKRRGILARYALDIDAMYAGTEDPGPPVPAPAEPMAAEVPIAPVALVDPTPAVDLAGVGPGLVPVVGLGDTDVFGASETPEDVDEDATPATPATLFDQDDIDEFTPVDEFTAVDEFDHQDASDERPPAVPPDLPGNLHFVVDDDEAPPPVDTTIVWGEEEPRPLWRRWWFLVLAAVVAAGLAWGAVTMLGDDDASSPDTTAAPAATTAPAAPTAATTVPVTTAPPSPAPTTAPVTSAAAPTTTAPANTLLFAIGQTPGLDTFLTALDTAKLSGRLELDEPITVFAPTDEAFARLDPAVLEALLADPKTLEQVLLHHMTEGRVFVSDLDETDWPMLDGTSVEVEAVIDLTLDGARLVDTDRVTVNGVLHTIDTVLIPAGVDLSAEASGTTTSGPTTTVSPLTGPGTDFVVPFDSGSGVLNSAGRAVVAEAADAIALLPDGSVVIITGVTDNIGSAADNDYLAGLRANSVISALRRAGATNVRYEVKKVQETPTGNPADSRRVDIDLA